MIDSLIGILETHGIAGLMLGILSYIVLSQLATIKGLHKQMEDTAHIFAIKIETKIDSLVGEVHDVGTESARVGGMVQSEQIRQSRR